MVLVKRSGLRASRQPLSHHHKRGAHQKKRLQPHRVTPQPVSHMQLFLFRLAPTFWLQKLSWQLILPCKFITCLYQKLPESFIATYLTISAFTPVIKEINRSRERVSMGKGPPLWRNNSLSLPETSKCCPASENSLA